MTQPLYVSLIHYPVVNRNSEIVTSSVTNLDIHDIARASRTFGVKRYFIVHPSPDQQALNQRIIRHWLGAYGENSNPTRGDALRLVRLLDSFEMALEEIETETGMKPLCVGTSARPHSSKNLTVRQLRQEMETRPVLLIFGTGYGLAADWSQKLDFFLPPIGSPVDYNHLSVRSAVSIYLDRIFNAL